MSVPTALGYVSLVDLIVAAFFACALIKSLKAGKVPKRNMGVLVLSVTVYMTVAVLQGVNGLLADASVLLKYAIFLCIVPVAIILSKVNLHSDGFVERIASVLALSGGLLSLAALIQVARGDAHYSGGSYYVNLAGQLVNKNGLASLLLYGIVSSAWLAMARKRKIFWALCAMQLSVTFILGARSATLIGMITVPALGLAISKSMLAGSLKYCGLALGFGALSLLAAGSGLFTDQVDRIAELSQFETRDVTAASSRLLLWDFAWHEIQAAPWLGSGAGAFSYVGTGWLHGMYEPHNAFLQIAHAWGVVGVLMFTVLVAPALPRATHFPEGMFLIAMLGAYLANMLVGIIWVRGDGHLFWILTFLILFSSGRRIKHQPASVGDAAHGNFAPSQREVRY